MPVVALKAANHTHGMYRSDCSSIGVVHAWREARMDGVGCISQRPDGKGPMQHKAPPSHAKPNRPAILTALTAVMQETTHETTQETTQETYTSSPG